MSVSVGPGLVSILLSHNTVTPSPESPPPLSTTLGDPTVSTAALTTVMNSTALAPPEPTTRGIQANTSSRSKTRVVGPTTGVLGAVLICLAIFLYIRRRTIPWPSVIRREHRKKNAEESVLPAVPENENNAVSLTLRLESGRRSWTGQTSEHGGRAGVVSRQHLTEATNNILKHPAPSLNNVPESLQSTPVPMSSVMQEMDNIRARMAELERQQQETRRNLHLSSVDSGEAMITDQHRRRIQMMVVTEISD